MGYTAALTLWVGRGWQALDAFLNVEPVLEKGYKADAGKNAASTNRKHSTRKKWFQSMVVS